VGAMIGSPLNFGGAIGALTAQFDPLTEGATAVSVTTPAGFETAANFRQITATVAAPAINGFSGASARVGEDMQDAVSISLGVTPPSAVDITVSIASTSIARVSDSGTLLGGAIIVIPGVANTTARTVFLQGMAQGATQVTVSAPGYATNTQTINVDPSGFIINSPSAITTTAAAANSNVQIAAARLQAGTFSFQENEAVRAGLTVAVPVTSSNPAAGAITISPLNFGANTGSLTTQFDPLAAGAATIVVGAPAGFDASNNFRQITATVNP
ncbi:MAG: hypothetical protein ACREV5_14125, partial [Steroidobacter sp.]